jgi:alkylation response protein AidB-like acyl-CoA dehydrogenase
VTETATREDELALEATIRAYLERRSPISQVRRLMETSSGYDQQVWRHMADQMGLPGLHVPEEYGGQGFSFVELGIAAEEMGRALACAPFFATVCLATNAILNAGTPEQKSALLPDLVSGERTGTLAILEPGSSWDVTDVHVTAQRQDDGRYLLRGTKAYVVDGATASLIVVAAREPGTEGRTGLSLFTVEAHAGGLTRTELFPMDQTRKLARLDFSGTPASPLGTPGEAFDALTLTMDQAAVCLAADQLGGAQAALGMAVEYAKTRIQFGRAIGSFQGLKHRLADLWQHVENARTAARHAARVAARGDAADLPLAAALAQFTCSNAYLKVAADNIQVHGGIGFTWEHDAHLHLKRAKSSELLFGDATYHRTRLGDAIGV